MKVLVAIPVMGLLMIGCSRPQPATTTNRFGTIVEYHQPITWPYKPKIESVVDGPSYNLAPVGSETEDYGPVMALGSSSRIGVGLDMSGNARVIVGNPYGGLPMPPLPHGTTMTSEGLMIKLAEID